MPSFGRRWSQGAQQTSPDLVGVASRAWVQLFGSAISNSPERSRAQAVLCSRVRRQTAMVVASDCGVLDRVAYKKQNASFETDGTALMVEDRDDDNDDHSAQQQQQQHLNPILATSRPVTWTPIGVQYRLEHPRSVRELMLCVPVLWCSLWSASPRTWIQYDQLQTLPSDWVTRIRHRLAKWSTDRETSATHSSSAADMMLAQTLDASVLAEASLSRTASRRLVRPSAQVPSVFLCNRNGGPNNLVASTITTCAWKHRLLSSRHARGWSRHSERYPWRGELNILVGVVPVPGLA
ncbi:hypothetical protein F1559_004749 [Cyanidiococcus yangmingshanensis]|uniref:Uncharacterized protein n=1 Tax=Cyanidiococcus yangmingshanensis TaxID=2690220 RepID=A0A7J7IQT5_9RHOD|nr:hypothetical protein F1559_004749 [Cyanidiococcus yangmingshanensis]